jgi:hypothetical protein
MDLSNIAGPSAALNAAFHELANYFPMPYLGFASWVASIVSNIYDTPATISGHHAQGE